MTAARAGAALAPPSLSLRLLCSPAALRCPPRQSLAQSPCSSRSGLRPHPTDDSEPRCGRGRVRHVRGPRAPPQTLVRHARHVRSAAAALRAAGPCRNGASPARGCALPRCGRRLAGCAPLPQPAALLAPGSPPRSLSLPLSLTQPPPTLFLSLSCRATASPGHPFRRHGASAGVTGTGRSPGSPAGRRPAAGLGRGLRRRLCRRLGRRHPRRMERAGVGRGEGAGVGGPHRVRAGGVDQRLVPRLLGPRRRRRGSGRRRRRIRTGRSGRRPGRLQTAGRAGGVAVAGAAAGGGGHKRARLGDRAGPGGGAGPPAPAAASGPGRAGE